MSCDVGEETERLENELCSTVYSTVYSCAHSPSFQSLHLRHSSFSNPSLALPTSQLILQPFRCFTYVTAHSPTLLSLLLRHRIFTYVTWRAAHAKYNRVVTIFVIQSCHILVPNYALIIQIFFLLLKTQPYCISETLILSSVYLTASRHRMKKRLYVCVDDGCNDIRKFRNTGIIKIQV